MTHFGLEDSTEPEMTLDLRSFARKVRVTDGVYGTQLQAAGLMAAGACVELLNADNPAAAGRHFIRTSRRVLAEA